MDEFKDKQRNKYVACLPCGTYSRSRQNMCHSRSLVLHSRQLHPSMSFLAIKCVVPCKKTPRNCTSTLNAFLVHSNHSSINSKSPVAKIVINSFLKTFQEPQCSAVRWRLRTKIILLHKCLRPKNLHQNQNSPDIMKSKH